jgi:hypothetical protein
MWGDTQENEYCLLAQHAAQRVFMYFQSPMPSQNQQITSFKYKILVNITVKSKESKI